MDLVTLALFAAGLIMLIIGAEALVRGASRLAHAMGVSPLVIGLTVVAYGTSAPEAAVSVQSAAMGQTGIALGNVIGSNILNILFVLGLSALITPLVVSRQLVRLDVPIMFGVTLLLFVLSLDGMINRWEGICLLGGRLAYTGFTIWQSRREQGLATESCSAEPGAGAAKPDEGALRQIVLIVIGLAMLVLGSRWLVDGAVALATALGISELVIGLTIVAAGTSLPEVATSMVAALRDERDIAVGNIIGSNIFNILLVIGLASIVSHDGMQVPAAVVRFDMPVMLAVALACFPIFFTGHLIARWEGGLFVGYYAAYMLYLLLAAVEHDALHTFSTIMLVFVVPLTMITLCLLVVRALGQSTPPPP